MIERREFLLLASATVLVAPVRGLAESTRLTFDGSLEQGSLVLGHVEPGAKVELNGNALSVSQAGMFCFGFEYNDTKPVEILAHFADGTKETRPVAPVARQYEIQRITLPDKFVNMPDDVLERRKREIAMIVAARKTDTDSSGFAEKFDWPVPGIISGLFGSQRILNGVPKSPHFGVDIAVGAGTPIAAPAPARVALAEPDFYLEGGLTILDHGHGVNTCYMHQSKQMVKQGDTVARGQAIGLVGMTGRATGPHMHWGMNWFQMAVDPSRSTRMPAPPKA
ncbi:MAG TPA: M23 family metallopeptidase [Rhizomicrobium sp.]|jgi:murein DD-endopeptidase MepM/ murein hydrolase activator NlpD